MEKSANSYQLIFHFLKPYKLRYIAIFSTSLILALVECFNVAIFLPIFQSFLNQPSETGEFGSLMTIIQKIIVFFPMDNKMIAACLLLIGFSLLKFFMALFNRYLISVTSAKVMFDLKKRIIVKYINAQYQYFINTKQGHLLYISSTSPNKVALALYRVPILLNTFVILAGILIFLLTVNPLMTYILAIGSLMFYFFISKLSKKKIYHIGKEMAASLSELNSVLNEFITGIKQIYVYNASRQWLKKHEQANQQYSRFYAAYNIFSILPKNLVELVVIPGLMIAATVVYIVNPQRFLSLVPVLGMFTVAVIRILPYISMLGTVQMHMSVNLRDCELVYDELKKPNDREITGDRDFQRLQDPIVFDAIKFSYDGRNPVLRGLNCSFEKNQMTALVGKSGSGKSTVINLLLGLYRPEQGRILVNGVDLFRYQPQSWLQKIGFVSQDTFIFHATIAENIAFDSQDYSMQEIIESAKIANAHDFIAQLPNGYNTIVGERGMKLSGGQQQRIAIARAVLRRPEIFILDEATSALDNESEALIRQSIDRVSENSTTIIIAHRLSTVKHAHKILLLNNGCIEEEGRHAELMNRKDGYWRLYTSKEFFIENDSVADGLPI